MAGRLLPRLASSPATAMKNTWDEEVEDHEPKDCKECHGQGVYKLPYGCDGPDGPECEDEDNCYCDCHGS